ncbi:aminodeoxychorismate synthase component I [Glaciimonas soli]|uniref:Aminodeoxychorismate synthase component I n=1 Tax=Glaciimonas soli TaxID=2590999 RepID=A0A843YUJ9_9BURK|nr:aminodeoxychorismate synthase component I [Glaciimonas soli]MQR01178.1 aminodeoxychorismate synthase component I [Glaciimonas soli]
MTQSTAATCFALLDDRRADAGVAASRLYSRHQTTLQCWQLVQLSQLITDMQAAMQQGLHAVALFNYELGAEMQGISTAANAAIRAEQMTEPLAQILLFEQCQQLRDAEVNSWLLQQIQAENPDQTDAVSGIANLHANVSETKFTAAIDRIHAYIEAGDTYQVNYTYRLRFDVYGNPLSLYRQLRQRQSVSYGALIALPDGRMVLSLSPELFVRYAQGLLTANPIKGTAPASGDAEHDKQVAHALANDPKNRAENLMITDLLRNDLGRIAQLGTVRVPQLFEVQRYNTILQMASTVQAQLRTDVTLQEVIAALYPCGSITGAPKHRTMQIIAELEPEPRRLYTGAIGWFDAPAAEHAIGDFCLSVPIRTLLLEAEQHGVRAGELGVGAGIVYDSVAADEYAECALKAKFLTGMQGEFLLFETMHVTTEGCRHLALHLQRLHASATYFGIACDEIDLRQQLNAYCAALPANAAYRLRLTLSANGLADISSAPLTPLQTPVKVLLSTQPTQADDIFLRHKTTVRNRYDQAWKAAEQQGAFDTLFFNQSGELTEGGRSNVFVKLDGHWYTPPLTAGVLPGVMRKVVLDDQTWNAVERTLTYADVRAAEQIMVCNALRGTLEAVLVA